MTDRPSPWMPLEGSEQAVALEVLLHGPLSRAELARRMHLSQASLSRLTKPLVRDGLLVEAQAPSTTGLGRPSRPLDVRDDAHHFLGIKLTGEHAYAAVTTMRGHVVHSASVAIPDHEPAAVVEVIAAVAQQAQDDVAALSGIGVSVGGHVSDGVLVTRGAFLEWTDVPLADLLRRSTGLPVVVENDVTSLTEAERWFGAGRRAETFTVLTVGAGIGYGLVVHGRLVTSSDSGLGPIGHIQLGAIGPRCAEGHAGCASATLTADSLSASFATTSGRWVGAAEILDLARAEMPAARRTVEDAGRALGCLAGTAASFCLSPVVVLAGELVDIAELAATEVQAGLRQVRHPLADEVRLERRPAGFGPWAQAAAVVAIQAFVSR